MNYALKMSILAQRCANVLAAMAVMAILMAALAPSQFSPSAIVWRQQFRHSIESDGSVEIFKLSPVPAEKVYFLDMYLWAEGRNHDVFDNALTDFEWFVWGNRQYGKYWLLVYETPSKTYYANWIDNDFVGLGAPMRVVTTDHSAKLQIRHPSPAVQTGCKEQQKRCLVLRSKEVDEETFGNM